MSTTKKTPDVYALVCGCACVHVLRVVAVASKRTTAHGAVAVASASAHGAVAKRIKADGDDILICLL